MSPQTPPPPKDRVDWFLWLLCASVLVAFGAFISWAHDFGGLL